MKLCSDVNGHDEISTNGFDLGIVKAGEKKEYTLYLVNDSSAELINVRVSFDSPDVKLMSAPVNLLALQDDLD